MKTVTSGRVFLCFRSSSILRQATFLVALLSSGAFSMSLSHRLTKGSNRSPSSTEFEVVRFLQHRLMKFSGQREEICQSTTTRCSTSPNRWLCSTAIDVIPTTAKPLPSKAGEWKKRREFGIGVCERTCGGSLTLKSGIWLTGCPCRFTLRPIVYSAFWLSCLCEWDPLFSFPFQHQASGKICPNEEVSLSVGTLGEGATRSITIKDAIDHFRILYSVMTTPETDAVSSTLWRHSALKKHEDLTLSTFLVWCVCSAFPGHGTAWRNVETIADLLVRCDFKIYAKNNQHDWPKKGTLDSVSQFLVFCIVFCK